MKGYEVQLHIKDYEHFPTIITVETNGREHPSKKAIEFHTKNGWNVDADELRIDRVKRIY